jgi:hypothetical protein
MHPLADIDNDPVTCEKCGKNLGREMYDMYCRSSYTSEIKPGQIPQVTIDEAAREIFHASEYEARSRFREEVVEALEDVPSHIKEPASSNGIFYDEASFNAGYRLAKQKSIETIKKL